MTEWKVAVYGSCVSRDLVPLLPARLTVYVARQSIISAMGHPIEDPPTPQLDSAFQRRMVMGDLTSNATSQLRAARRTQLLLLDLIDERFGVVALGKGRFVTPTHEFRAAGEEFLGRFPDARHLPFGSEEHWQEWTAAVGRFMRFLRQAGLSQRTRLLKTAFASRAEGGEIIPDVFDRSARDWNELYGRYYGYLEERGLVSIPLDESEARGQIDHQWGLAPYHYSDRSSRLLADRFLGSISVAAR